MTDPARLRPSDLFPALTIALPGGRSLRLPGALAGHFSVILFYRGSWCPYCNAQLRAFQRSLDRLTRLGVVVAALSVDDEATTKDLIARHSLRFPVGHSADARAVAAATGAFVNDDPVYLQSTGFVLGPGGRVAVSVYSSGAIGRLVPDDVIGLVRYLRNDAHSRQPSAVAPKAQRSSGLSTTTGAGAAPSGGGTPVTAACPAAAWKRAAGAVEARPCGQDDGLLAREHHSTEPISPK